MQRSWLSAVPIALLALGCVSIGGGVEADVPGGGGLGYEDERGAVQVVTTNVGGKNFFVPSTIVLTAGEGRKLTIYNTTDAPHGFQIPSLGVEVILPAAQELEVALPPLAPRRIYAINCHLHPPHRGAALVVLPAAAGSR
jgi:hypothetical protein